jgi:sugar phosphate permease
MMSMAVGLAGVALLPVAAPVRLIAALMVLVGLGGPFVAPPITAVLLSSVPATLAGTASGVFNTSRQIGGALAVAVFGAFLAQSTHFMTGLRISLFLAAGICLATALLGLRLRATQSPH